MQADQLAGQVVGNGARQLEREDRPHACANRLRAVRIGAVGAEGDARRAEGVGRANDRADVAGIADAVEVDTERSGRPRRPGLLVDADRAGARPKRRGAVEQRRVDLQPTAVVSVAGERTTESRRAEHDQGGDAGRERGRLEVLPLRDEPSRSLARRAPGQLPDLFEVLVFVGGDHRESSVNEKGAVL